MPKLTTYTQAEEWLLALTDYERLLGNAEIRYDTRSFDMERFRLQLTAIGDPHLAYAAIHVAGTKGKGSTCAFLESALRSCGFRTGLYTSPHLYRFTERIRVNGCVVSDQEFCRLLETMGNRFITPEGDEVGEPSQSFRTVFEILTAAAFQYFAEQQVDVAIIETGLGGRLDSTNVFDRPGDGPLINVVTAIGLDHTSILGNTIEEIATEKAGILRTHGRAVLSRQASPEYEIDVRNVVEKRLEELAAQHRLVSAADDMEILPGQNDERYRFRTRTGNVTMGTFEKALLDGLILKPSLEGAHQRNNAATALLALRELERGLDQWAERPAGGEWPVMEAAKMAIGFASTQWLGRFTVVDANVPVIIDGAHCVISAAALAETCRNRFGDRPAVMVTGFLRDKAGDAMLEAIKRRIPVTHAIALPPPSPRATSAGHILESLVNVFGAEAVTSAGSIQEAMDIARKQAELAGGYVVVFGSLYLVGPALDAVQAR